MGETATPLSPTELASRTNLHLSGIARALAALEASGVVELVGSGSRRPARLREDHPLAAAIRALFAAERVRVDRVIKALQHTANAVYPVPAAVWIQGPFTLSADAPADPLVVVLLTEAANVEAARDSFETALGDLERELDIVVEVRVRTRADLAVVTGEEREEFGTAFPLVGPPPSSLLDIPSAPADYSRAGIRTHADTEARGLAIASVIAERLRTDPSLVKRARDWVAGRLENASGGERRELREWDRILRTMSVARLRRFLVDDGERATRLRQTLPFVKVLSAGERKRLLDASLPAANSPKRK